MGGAVTASSLSGVWEISRTRVAIFLIAAAVLVVGTWVIGKIAKDTSAGSRKSFVLQLIEGADGRLSTSKAQAFVWTIVAVYGLLEVFIERFLAGDSSADQTIPLNLLIAMGFSATTMTAAKGITVAYVTNGLVDKAMPTQTKPGDATARPIGGLVTDDDGVPDLSKIQMLAFTAIAVMVYFVRLACPETGPQLVDIEPALMVLMGLSQGAYLGKKLTTTQAPRVKGLSPASGVAGIAVVVSGSSLGDTQADSVLHLDGIPVDTTLWTDTAVTFAVPQVRGPGLAWKNGDRVSVSLTVNGRVVPSPIAFVYTAPAP